MTETYPGRWKNHSPTWSIRTPLGIVAPTNHHSSDWEQWGRYNSTCFPKYGCCVWESGFSPPKKLHSMGKLWLITFHRYSIFSDTLNDHGEPTWATYSGPAIWPKIGVKRLVANSAWLDWRLLAFIWTLGVFQIALLNHHCGLSWSNFTYLIFRRSSQDVHLDMVYLGISQPERAWYACKAWRPLGTRTTWKWLTNMERLVSQGRFTDFQGVFPCVFSIKRRIPQNY
jgi:hypothetical protein